MENEVKAAGAGPAAGAGAGTGPSAGLTHVDSRGQARMVNISQKPETIRQAEAQGMVSCSAEAAQLLATGQLQKGDALAVARIAGISAAKRTWDLIPLCHQIPLSGVELDICPQAESLTLRCRVSTTASTGVEMEALTAVSVAALTLIDMIKAVDRNVKIQEIRLVSKSGGRSGSWAYDALADKVVNVEVGGLDLVPASTSENDLETAALGAATVLTISDRCARGLAEDESGKIIADALEVLGFNPVVREIVPDEIAAIQTAIRAAVAGAAQLVITTGGTGVAPRDKTPEACQPLLTRSLSGLAQGLRQHGQQYLPTAALSRGEAGLVEDTVLLNLPGSAAGVTQGMEYLSGILPHLIDQISGGDHERKSHV